MKKTILKSAIVLVAVTIPSLYAWKTDGGDGPSDQTLLSENIEALGLMENDSQPFELKPIWILDKTGFCYESVWSGLSRTNKNTGRLEFYYEAQVVGGVNNTWVDCVLSASVEGKDLCTKSSCKVGSPLTSGLEGWRTALDY